MKERETDILKSITDYLTLKRYLFIRNNTGAFKTEAGGFVRFGQKGSPDVFVFVEGGFTLGVEVKTSKGRLSPEQEVWKARAEEIGMTYLVARSLDDIIKVGL